MSLVSELKVTLSGPRAKRILPYGAGVLVLLLTALAVYAAAVSPSKAPYREALAKFQNVYDANVAFTNAGAATGATTATDEQFTENIAVTRTALETLQTEVTALGKKEMMQQGDGKTLYDTFAAKFQAYKEYNTRILTTIEKVRPVLFKCNQESANLTEDEAGAAALRTCVEGLKAVGTVPDADYQTMLDSFMKSYAELADNITAAAALRDPDDADKQQASTLKDERDAIISSLTSASRTLSKDLQTHRAEVDITESAKALSDYLNKKASIFSFS